MQRSTSHCLLWKGIKGDEDCFSVNAAVNKPLSVMEGNKGRRGLLQCERTLSLASLLLLDVSWSHLNSGDSSAFVVTLLLTG
jgi:hypothetical protein